MPSRQASWLGLHVCLNVVVLNSFFRKFLRVMQWSSHCVPWQIDFVGVLFGLRPLFLVCVCFVVVCFAVSSGETQVWLGDLRVVVVWWFCVFFVAFDFDLPAHLDQLCPCTNVFSTAYAHVRTEP